VEQHHEEISYPECLRLLATHRFGRLGVVVEGVPLVFPMHYVLDDSHIVLRTNSGSKYACAPMTHVSFEIDEVDAGNQSGWSVLVQGPAEDVSTSIDPRSEHHRSLEFENWAHPPADRWLAIVPRQITGRRVTTAASS
jgi:nitroimidazol reductase NimA-like FMN-containing flavoprotein (pyridoxamine 5'-phosphate oxidase superfamily)